MLIIKVINNHNNELLTSFTLSGHMCCNFFKSVCDYVFSMFSAISNYYDNISIVLYRSNIAIDKIDVITTQDESRIDTYFKHWQTSQVIRHMVVAD